MLRLFGGRTGFTFIELLVVMAILAILALISMPRLLEPFGDARRSEAVATASAITSAMSNYYIDHEEYPSGEDSPEELVNWAGAGTGESVTLGEYLDLRNRNSIDHIASGSGSIDANDTNVTPLPDLGQHPHDWWIVVVFAGAQNTDGDDAECVITAERIHWRGLMR